MSPSLLGFIICFAPKAAPNKMQTPPTTMYDQPRKGFLPPKKEVVEITRDFVPPNLITSKLALIVNDTCVLN